MKYRVLLADDNTAILNRVTTILSPEFDVVGRVTDGQALVEATVRLQPDLVVVDISMPNLNGLQAVERLVGVFSAARIVFMTVHTDSDFAAAAFRAGAHGFVAKARLTLDLIPALKMALARQRFVSPGIRVQPVGQRSKAVPDCPRAICP